MAQGKSATKLIAMLRVWYPDIPDGHWEIHRVRAGHHQRSAGAFSFFLMWDGPKTEESMRFNNWIGSQYPVWQILKYGIDGISPSQGDAHINPKLPEQ
jgi:hypothetical protein